MRLRAAGQCRTGPANAVDEVLAGRVAAQEDAVGVGRESVKVRERLTRIQEQLGRVRASQRVLDEQVSHLDELAADADTRRLVARTPLADREWRRARTDLDRHAALLEETRRQEESLLAERDRLLERLFELEGPS